MHEAFRVYSDKLVESADNDTFQKLIVEVMKKNLEVSHPSELHISQSMLNCTYWVTNNFDSYTFRIGSLTMINFKNLN